MSGPSTKQTSDKKSQVPERIKSDLQLFKSLMIQNKNFCGKKHLIENCLYEKLHLAQNPFIYVLDLIYYSSDIMRGHSSIYNRNVFCLFKEWLEKNPINDPIDLEVKKLAVNMFIQMKNSSGIEIACQIFNLHEDRIAFKEIIENHLRSGHYQQVCPVIIALDLQPFFTLDQVVLPLIFKDHRVDAEQYLQGYPEMQLELVKSLDEATVNRNALNLFIMKLNIQSKSISKFDVRYVQKILGKLLNTFKIPIEECPHLLQKRSYGALNYMIKKRFQDHEMTNESFEEMALSAVKDNLNLQQELITSLIAYNEIAFALKIAKTLNLPKKYWHSRLLSYKEEDSTSSAVASYPTVPTEECWDEHPCEPMENYLSLRIDRSSIYFVDTVKKFMDAIDTIEAYDVVGFDAEWRPSFGVNSTSKLALLQLAIWDCVFLLDILALTKCLDSFHWSHFIERIFCNRNILKLGFATSVDLDMLKTYCSGKNKNLSFNQVLDLDPFVRKIMINNPKIKMHLPAVDENTSNFVADKGLSKVCRMILGLPLNKTEQFSDWERRPLREAQVNYAALDSFCLLQIYEKLFECVRLLDSDIHELIEDYFKPKPKDLKPQKGLSKNDKQVLLQSMAEHKKIHYSRPSVPISQFKVVVDNMLNGLGKELRICGADVVILENSVNHSEAVKIALAENRSFLTTGKVFNQLAGYMDPGKCFCVNIGPVQTQLSEICDYFNIYCTETDVFSRCTMCNCNQYLNISSKDMETLWTSYKSFPPASLSENSKNLKPFIYCDGGFVTAKGTMHTGVKMHLDGFSETVLSEQDMFFVCTECGKLYWEGSHHRRKKEALNSFIISSLQENESPEGSHLYEKSTLKNSPSSTSPKSKESVPLTYNMVPVEEFSSDDDNEMVFNF